MRLTADVAKQRPEIVAEHKGESFFFSASIFTRKAFQDTEVFDQINKYWSEQPEVFQDKVFEIYRDINQGFEEIFVSDDLMTHLRDCIRRMKALHSLDIFKEWLSRPENGIRIPDTVKDLPPDANDVINTADKTYTRPEYMDLISLAMFFRTIMAVLGEYIGSIRRDTGVDRKEYVAMQLLEGTGVFETRAMEKLLIYTTRLAQSSQQDLGKIINNFSSERMPFLYLSLVCIRKICVADITGSEMSPNIIAVIFKFISHRISSGDNRNIIDKERHGGSDDGGKHSFLENYRKRLEISEGEKVELKFILDRPIELVTYLDPTLPVEDVIASMKTAAELKYSEVSDLQLYLAGTIIKAYVTPKSCFYVDAETHAGLFGALEALLWHRGHRYLALLMSSHLITNVEEIIVNSVSAREQLSPVLTEKLNYWFPYHYGYTKKTRDPKNAFIMVEKTDIGTAIDHIVDELVSGTYRMTASESKILDVFPEARRRFTIFSNIKNLIAEFLIDNEERISKLPSMPLEAANWTNATYSRG